MKTYTVNFDCKYKWGQVTIRCNEPEIKEVAEKKIKVGAWCENRCDKCKLKLKVL